MPDTPVNAVNCPGAGRKTVRIPEKRGPVQKIIEWKVGEPRGDDGARRRTRSTFKRNLMVNIQAGRRINYLAVGDKFKFSRM